MKAKVPKRCLGSQNPGTCGIARQIRTNFRDYLGTLNEDGALDPAAIADAYWMVHSQHRSAWTHELDLRPYSENW